MVALKTHLCPPVYKRLPRQAWLLRVRRRVRTAYGEPLEDAVWREVDTLLLPSDAR
jgi:hypothetical protein